MNTFDLLAYLKAKGARMTASQGKLKFSAPAGLITPELSATLKENKAEIISLLEHREEGFSFFNDIVLGDSEHELKNIPSDSIDLMVTDAPYGIGFMGRNWDKATPAVEIWKECLRVLKPGALAFVMCTPRQDCLCRMISNLMDAGFEANFTSLYWTYASGFPKAHNVGKVLDKRERGFDIQRFVVRSREKPEAGIVDGSGYKVVDYIRGVSVPPKHKKNGTGGISRGAVHVKQVPAWIPVYETNNPFSGAYAGFQPKPAVEVILVVMKPTNEATYAGQALENGKGITWLNDCRIPYTSQSEIWVQEGGVRWSPEREWNNDVLRHASAKGRFPANLVVSDEVLDDGNHKVGSGKIVLRQAGTGAGILAQYDGRKTMPKIHAGLKTVRSINDSGGYSRFFSLDAWIERNLPFLIVPKASKREKDTGVEGIEKVKSRDSRKALIDNPYQRGETLRNNSHETVKPVQLMSYLIMMGSREGDIVLDPFCGSGSTCIAAKLLGRQYIGIELNPKYHDIAVKRVAAA
jgi:DNA modification methylase